MSLPSYDKDELLRAAGQFSRHVQARDERWLVKRKRRRWMTPRRIALFLTLDLVLGVLGWHLLTDGTPGGAIGAVDAVAASVEHHDWQSVYDQLCSADREQNTEAQIAQEGQAALLALGGVDKVTGLTARRVGVPVGPLHWPAVTVSGTIQPTFGQASGFSVTVIRDLGGWQVCLSVGGYTSTALNINVPLTS